MNSPLRSLLRFICAAAGTWIFLSGPQTSLSAAQQAFTLSGATLILEDVTSDVGVFYSSMRFNRAGNVWNVEVGLTNRSTRTFAGPFVLLVDQFTGTTGPRETDGTNENAKVFYDLSATVPDGELSPGERSPGRTITLGFAAGSPALTTRIFVKPAAEALGLAVARTLDGSGQPLPGVAVEETGPDGIRTFNSDSRFGLITLGQRAGAHVWKFTRAGHLPVWRTATLTSNEVLRVPYPRLMARSTNTVILNTSSGAELNTEGTVIQFAPGSVAQATAATLTPLTGQTLPGLLPAGWSPLRTFWLEADGGLLQTATTKLTPSVAIPVSETATFVQWDVNTASWQVLQTFFGDGQNPINTLIAASGVYALVVPDLGFTAPPPAIVGQPLPGSSFVPPAPSGLRASGLVTPAVNAASRRADLVTGIASVTVSNIAGVLPSGTLLNCEIREEYQMQDGTRRITPRYDTFITGFQRPGQGEGSLNAEFPLRPLMLLGGEELLEARVAVEIIPSGAFTGSVLDTNGGLVVSGGVQVIAGTDDFAQRQGALLRRFDPTNFLGLAIGSNVIADSFQLDVADVQPAHHLAARFGPQASNSVFVLARILSQDGLYGIKPVERFASGLNGQVQSSEPVSGERLPGITGAGQYLLLRTPQAQTLIMGAARDPQSNALVSAAVRLNPWLTFSDTNGNYRLLAPTGTVNLTVIDPTTGDAGQQSFSVTNGQNVLLANLSTAPTGPHVLNVNPTNGALSVSRVTPIVLTFSEPVNPGTLVGGGMQLLRTNNTPVAGSLSLNLAGTTATFLPTDPLAANTLFKIQLSTNVSDLTGHTLEGANTFVFTTETDSLNRGAAQLTIYEPTNGLAAIFGTPGSADPESTVILVNETTGETATSVSESDGSFTNFIAADVDDFISAVLVNLNGTRTTLPASRQIFRDGSVGLFKSGGILEAESDGGPVQVLIEPGAIPNKTKFNLDPVGMTELLALLQNTQPESGQILGGFRFSTEGDELKTPADVVFPVDIATLHLEPGESPTNRAFALCEPIDVDGVKMFSIIDRMHYENGNLVTHSPPFPGLGATSAGNLLAIPILMAFGTQINIVGQVVTVAEAAGIITKEELRAGVSTNGFPIRRLPGAIVNATAQSTVNSTTATLRPGAIVSKANRNGFYAMIFPVNSLNPDAILMRSVHPKFPGIEGRTPLVPRPGTEFLAADVANIVLRLPGSGNFLDSIPPTLTISLPGILQVRTNQTVTLNLRDDSSVPALSSATIDYSASTALIPNRTLFAGEATISVGMVSNTGPTSVQIPVTFNVTTTAVVAVEAVVQDAAGNSRTNRLDLRFGAPPPSGTNSVPAADPNDVTGPKVIAVNPQKDGVISHGQMIVRFDEPVDKTIETNASAVTISPPVQMTRKLSLNQQEMLILFSALQPDTSYTVTFNPGQISDVSGNGLSPSYTTSFKTPPATALALADVQNAVGTLALGSFNFTLDQSQNDGALVSHLAGGLSAKTGSLSLPPFPRVMALVPEYSFKRTTNAGAVVETKPLIVAAGGLLGEGNVGQWLWVIDISNPTNMVRIASELATIDFTAAITSMKWSAPRLCFTETRPEGSLIHHVNLQAFIIGANGTTLPQYQPGVDSNGDGDFVDAGDTLPIPERLTLFGDEIVLAMEDRRIISDFDAAFGGAFEVAVAANRGTQPSFLQVMNWQGSPIDQPGIGTDGRVNFPLGANNSQARRVVLDLNFPLSDTTGTRLIPAAIVAVDNELRIFDLTDPIVPVAVRTNQLGANAQNIFSVARSGDNEYAVGTPNGVFLLSRVLMGSLDGLTLAVTENFTGLPMQGRVLGGNDVMLSAAYGGVARLIARSPRLRVVRVLPFPVLPVDSLLQSNRTFRAEFVKAAAESEFLLPVPLSRCDGIPTELNSTNAPNPLYNQYPLVRMIGTSGAEIFVAMESLTRGMELQSPKGSDYPPIILSEQAGSMGFGSQHPNVHGLKLKRLSDNPLDDLFNTYIGTPFLLTVAPLSSNEQARVTSVIGRQAVWSGDFLRFSFDVAQNGEPPLAPYLSALQNFVFKPGLSRAYRGLRGEYLDSPNRSFARAAPRVAGVDLQNGEFRHAETDIYIEGRQQPLAWSRVYESRSRYLGPMGRGWDFNYNARIVELPELDLPDGYAFGVNARGDGCERLDGCGVMFIDGSGAVLTFRCLNVGDPDFAAYATDPALDQFLGNSAGANGAAKVARFYASPPDIFSVLYKLVNGHFLLVMPNGGRMEFLPDGRLDKSIGAFSKSVVQCQYDDQSRLIEVVGDRGIKLEIGYYKRFPSSDFGLADIASSNPLHLGKIARVRAQPTIANKSEVVYEYDSIGNLERIKPAQAAETVLVWSQGNPHEMLSIGRVDGTQMPGEAMTYVNGLVSSVNFDGDTLSFSGAKSTSKERFDAGPSTVSVSSSSGGATFEVDNRGRPTKFANRPFKADDSGQATRVADVYSDAQIKYDSSNTVYRFRGNLLQTMEGPAGAPGKFVTGNAYDGSAWNRIVASTNVDGLVTLYDYSLAGDFSQNGEIKEGTGPVIVRRQHNEFGQVATETLQDASAGIAPPFDKSYAYGSAGLSSDGGLRTGTSAPGLNGSTTSRDELGRSRTVGSAGVTYTTHYNNDGQPETILNLSGTTPSTGYTYDQGLVKTEGLDVGALHVLNTYTYDGIQKTKVHQLDRSETGLPPSSTIYNYDGQGRLLSYTADGEQFVLTYDGSLTKSFDGPGRARTVTYGSGGLADSITEQGITADLEYDTANRLKKVTQQGASTGFTYDDAGSNLRRRLKKKETSGATGGVVSSTTYTYDGAGRVASMTSRSGRLRELEYFANNEVRQMKINGTPVREAQRNAAGLLTQSRVNDLRYEYFNFDAVHGRPLGERLTLQPSGRTVERQVTYDPLGRVKTVTIAGNGGSYRYDYDGFSNPVLRSDPDGVATTQAASPGGKILSIGFSDGHGGSYSYTPQRRVDLISGGAAPLDMQYGSDGLVNQITYPDGTLTKFQNRNAFFEPDTVFQGSVEQKQTWDEGRLTAIETPSTGDALEYEFDVEGRQTSAALNDYSVGLAYNADGQLSAETNSDATISRAWSASFNALNHLLAETYPSGLQLNFAPDTFGHPTSASAVGINSVDWIGGGLIERVRHSGGLRMVRHYDSALRLADISYETGPDGSPVVVAGFDYGLTAGGRVLYEHRAHEGRSDVFKRNLVTEGMRIKDFFFSGTNLTSGAGAQASVIGLTFNNVSEIQSPGATTGIDARGLQPAITEAGGRVITLDGLPVRYNDRGSATNVPLWIYLPGATILTRVPAILDYDGFGHLSRVQRDDGVEINYGHDGFGRIVYRAVTGPAGRVRQSTNEYFWSGNRLLEEREQTSAGPAFRRYVYLGRYFVLLQMASSTSGPFTNYVPLVTLNGSIGGYATSSGELVEKILYGAYGAPVFDSPLDDRHPGGRSAVANTLLFHGAFYDEATGLYEMGVRNLHPQSGRFLQRDPALFVESLAMFTAFNGDPAGRVDPFGAFSFSEVLDAKDQFDEGKKTAEEFGKSADGFLAALNDSRLDRERKGSALGLAGLDLASSGLQLAATFGDEDFKTFVSDTTGALGHAKTILEIAGTASELANDREMLSAIKAVAWSRPVPGFYSVRQVLQDGGSYSAISIGSLEQRFGEDSNFKRAKFYDINRESRSGIVNDATEDYLNKRTGHLLSIGKGVHTLLDAYLQKSLEGNTTHTADVQRQLSKTTGKLLDFAEAYRAALGSKELEIMRTVYGAESVGLVRTLGAAEVGSAVYAAYQVGFEAGKLGIMALNDEDVAKAYEEQLSMFEQNGGWLTVASGLLSTVGADDTALLIQSFHDTDFVGPALKAYNDYVNYREKQAERTQHYLIGISAP